jgi:DNA-binding response OmpR family regulator
MDNQGIKILVAEDDKFLLKIYQTKLTKEGFNIIIASDGEEAIQKIKSEKPSLLILDLLLPKKSGFEVLEEIKADPETKDIAVIISSNLGQDADVERGLKLGAVDYMIKANLSITEVMDKIKKYIDTSGQVLASKPPVESAKLLCPECNTEISQTATFCPNCGTKLK